MDITIFDMMGGSVNTLIHSKLEAGDYSVQWNTTIANGQRVLPGIYFCKMIAGDNVFVKRMNVIDMQ